MENTKRKHALNRSLFNLRDGVQTNKMEVRTELGSVNPNRLYRHDVNLSRPNIALPNLSCPQIHPNIPANWMFMSKIYAVCQAVQTSLPLECFWNTFHLEMFMPYPDTLCHRDHSNILSLVWTLNSVLVLFQQLL